MTLPTGSNQTSSAEPGLLARHPKVAAPAGLRGFTLIELILVMAILVVVLGVSAPSLSRFFGGRTLDSETKRFVALIRYGQSRAVSDGIPFILWIDPKQGAYGLRADSSYTDQEIRPLEYQLNKDMQVEVEQPPLSRTLTTIWKGDGGIAASIPKIRFTPEGFVTETSPQWVLFRHDKDEVLIGPTRNHLTYEIQTNQLQRIR